MIGRWCRHLNGFVARKGREVGVPTPCCDAVVDFVHAAGDSSRLVDLAPPPPPPPPPPVLMMMVMMMVMMVMMMVMSPSLHITMIDLPLPLPTPKFLGPFVLSVSGCTRCVLKK